MSYFGQIQISAADTSSVDGFSRFRVSEPKSIFDSKQLWDNLPWLWDDQEVSGSGTSSTHSTDTASSVMAVSATTAGNRTRQTLMRFNYQPGKSQLIFMTVTLNVSGGGVGITRGVGVYDDNDGIFFLDDEGVFKVVLRSSVTGSAVDTKVAQTSWNLDKMDGLGASGSTLDLTKSQIMVIDYEWLGVGRIRMGFVIDGMIIYCHEFLNSNLIAGTYMSTPNLPLRYEIENDGTGVVSSMDSICSSVMSEGGQETLGITHHLSTGGTHVDANTADTIYALVGYRLKTTHLDSIVINKGISLISETNDDFEWILFINPTVAGTFTYSDEANTTVQSAKGATANTITGGVALQGGFEKQTASTSILIDTPLRAGSAIDGTRDEIVLGVRPLSNNADIQGSITIKELL